MQSTSNYIELPKSTKKNLEESQSTIEGYLLAPTGAVKVMVC